MSDLCFKDYNRRPAANNLKYIKNIASLDHDLKVQVLSVVAVAPLNAPSARRPPSFGIAGALAVCKTWSMKLNT